jgi:2-polyprenyl-6-methoxyphenol hydroxylase-like FAD-dependent oxidoreductase
MYDALIVGARCAGSPTAMLLARKGYRVLLVDRATFPSDAPRNHVIHAPGIARLKQWGLLDKVIASNCPPLRHITFDLGPFALVGSSPAIDGISEGYGPRRKVLDTILVDAARASGVEVREGFSVQEVRMDGDRVIGIRGRTAGGRIVTETARIVIGADGMHSSVAHTVQAPEYDTKPTLSCAYYTYYSGVPIEGAELYMRGRRLIGAFPTNDGLLCSLVQFPNQEFHAFRSDIVGNYQEQLDLVPSLAERLRNGKQEERFVGTADLPNFFRKPYGPGWALVGDAGYHKDPYTGQGITDAFRDAEQLVEALDAGFTGRRLLEDALANYEQQRNDHVRPMYAFTCQLASFEPPAPEMLQLFAALRGNQTETDRMLGTITGTVPIPEFYAPENLRRIVASADLEAPLLPQLTQVKSVSNLQLPAA